ncbi:MAG: amylosucrase, partial [Ruminococcus sp.]|nr:amylosucrase [Ruminococcus sp.]
YMFTQSGIPVIYSGDEVGQLNDYMYHADIKKKFDSRYLHRGKFDWELAAARRDASTYQGRIFSALRVLETARAANPVFKANAEFRSILTGSKNVLGIYRAYGGQELVALFNFGTEARMVAFPSTRPFVNLFTGKRHTRKSIELKPYEFIWALLK